MSINAVKVLLNTAWRKYHDGRRSDVYKILVCLLQDPLLDASGANSTLEYQVLTSEINLLLLHCRIEDQKPDEEIKSLKPLSSRQQNSQSNRMEVFQHSSLLMGLNLAKSTHNLAAHFTNASCSQELYRISLALRISNISLKTRKLMTHLNSWTGMIQEMKFFGDFTSQLSLQVAFSLR